MRRSSPGLAAALLLLGAALVTPAAAELPRRGFLGVAMASDRQAEPGATVTELIPGGTGAAIGVQVGDVVVRAGERAIASPADLISYASTLVGGAPVALLVRRGGREVELGGPAAERPREAYPAGRTDYGEVAWRGGALRDILVMPDGVDDPPVVFLIQGFSCSSIESVDPSSAYRRLGEGLIAAGVGYYRVEKPGLGDSAGTPNCAGIDYATELDAFRAAYRHLTDGRDIPAERIFMLGHSLGGIQAPMLAAERAPRGVAVFGTVLRNWADYHLAVDQFQDWLMRGADPAEAIRAAETRRDVFRRFYLEGETPAAVAAADPAFAEGLRYSFAWDGGENIFGRHYLYAQQLAGLRLFDAWRDARTNVLAIYGESDLVALFDEDHRLIADLANNYRPGTGRYVEVAGTGHGMDLIGGRQEVRERFRATGQPPQGDFNLEIARRLAEWVGEAMARPPVAAAGG